HLLRSPSRTAHCALRTAHCGDEPVGENCKSMTDISGWRLSLAFPPLSLRCLVDFSLPAERVIRSLNQIIEWRGKPFVIRVDNGPEYVSGKLMEWAANQGIALTHIQPGKPQQNAYVERYNRTVRHEWLDQYIIENIEEAQEFATQWLWTYNNERPNMGIGGITPAQKLKMAA
ncbi:integrase core domain-containing protein, partial [Rhizobium sp. PDO1-076]|uniref:integrase core domain-containing protein n=1 Tax=Rhizobium sp. PDO1-076 TaxID=1125979 RepID=UPI001FCAEF58